MNVGELRKLLGKFPSEMEIAYDKYSDYALLQEAQISVVQGVDKDGWVMRSHPTMGAENKAGEKSYVYLELN